MITVKVWLLVMVGHVYSGDLGAVQPQMFPTVEDCEHVVRSAQKGPYGGAPTWRCVQTNVLVPK